MTNPVTDATTLSSYDYGSCPYRFEQIDNGGHIWPGNPEQTEANGPISLDLDATEAVVNFFGL